MPRGDFSSQPSLVAFETSESKRRHNGALGVILMLVMKTGSIIISNHNVVADCRVPQAFELRYRIAFGFNGTLKR